MNKIRIIIYSILINVVLCNCFIAHASVIEINGNERIESDTIRSYLLFDNSEDFNQEKIDKSIKRLYASNLFSSVSIEKNGNKIIINLVENPKINQITFEGNKSIKRDILENEIILKSRMVYTKSRLQEDVNRIIEIYNQNGRYAVKVDPKIIKLPQNRVNLIFEISEGAKTKIDRIFFVGNDHFKDAKLKSAIHSQETRWYNFFSTSDLFSTSAVELDKDLLREYYRSKGYAAFKVISSTAEISENKDKFYITFSLEEGQKYKYGKISINNRLNNINEAELNQNIETITGNIFNGKDVDKSVDQLTKIINDLGYAFVNIDAIEDIDSKNGTVNIVYLIEEGHKVYLNRINILGNVKTADKVIRREFRLAEGDPYNATKIIRSEQRIRDLNYFENINISTEKSDQPDKFDINAELSEKSTAGLNFSGGYSTSDGILGRVGFTEDNLFGNGQQIGIGFGKSKKKTDIELNFTEPYFLDKPLAAGFDIHDNHSDKDNSRYRPYSSKSRGAGIRIGYDIIDKLRHSMRYSYTDSSIYDVDDKSSDLIKSQSGSRQVSAIGHRISYENRDSMIEASQGYYVHLDQSIAGLGGNTKYFKNDVVGKYYIPVFNDDIIFQLGADIGYIRGLAGQDVKINDRFFMGSDNVRGFDFFGIGPRAKIKDANGNYKNDDYSGDALGGNIYYTSTAELKFPIPIQKELNVFSSLFIDMGNLYDIDASSDDKSKLFQSSGIRSSAGVSLGINTGMGPLRISYGVPITKEKYDHIRRFNIDFSTKL